jgi:hypothetical protein
MCFPQTTQTQAASGTVPSRSMAAVQQRAQGVTRLDPPSSVFTSPLGISQAQPRPVNRTILTGALA